MELLLVEVSRMLEPLAEAAQDPPEGILELAADAGLRLEDILVDAAALVEFATDFRTAYDALAPIVESGKLPDIKQLPTLFNVLREALTSLWALDDLAVREDVDVDVAAVGQRLLELLAVTYLRTHRRRVYHALLAPGMIDEGNREAGTPPRLRLAELPDVIRDPAGAVAAEYGWGTQDFSAYLLLSRLQKLGWYLDVPAVFHYPEAEEAQTLGTNPA